MKPFCELSADYLTSDILHHEIGSKGYVLVRNLLPRPAIARLLNDVTQVLSRAGWLKPGRDPNERIADLAAACGDPDPGFKKTYREVFNLESFHTLPHRRT